MRNLTCLSALTLLATGCFAKNAPVEAAAVAAAAEAPAVPAPAAPALTSSVTSAADAKWMSADPSKPDGPQMAVVQGNPKTGAFVAMAKFPAGFAGSVHSHPAAFTGVAMSGTTLNGRSADENTEMTPGTIWTAPANEVHFTGCTPDAECIIAAYMDGAMGMVPADAPMEGEMQVAVVKPDDVAWGPVNPSKPEGPQMHVISGDKATGPFRALVKLPGGAAGPEHTHSSTYSAIVLAGAISHGGPDGLGVGSFWTELGDTPHTTACVSEEPCIFFVSMDGAFDMKPTAPPPAAEPTEAVAE
jgi:quercetin dioxygenase-like cupin family protein